MARTTNSPAKDKKSFGKHLAAILKEMCRRVKAKYPEIDFKSQDWYRKYKWTRDQEHSFEEWMAAYLHGNREARWELLERRHANKTCCRKAATEFTFMYGWVLSD